MSQKAKSALSHINNIDIDALENSDINLSFEVAMLKLHECAMHVPGNDLNKDTEITALEKQLLSLQEDLLEKTAKIDIKTDVEFKLVKKVWQRAHGLKFDNDLNLLDRLALSLFQYSELKT